MSLVIGFFSGASGAVIGGDLRKSFFWGEDFTYRSA